MAEVAIVTTGNGEGDPLDEEFSVGGEFVSDENFVTKDTLDKEGDFNES